jgi:hypothetical protein
MMEIIAAWGAVLDIVLVIIEPENVIIWVAFISCIIAIYVSECAVYILQGTSILIPGSVHFEHRPGCVEDSGRDGLASYYLIPHAVPNPAHDHLGGLGCHEAII